MAFKTNKSFSKRFKITRKGKVIQRKAGINHFNAKESRKKQLNKKRVKTFEIKKKKISQYLPLNILLNL